jgi:hypothetical protein
MRVDDVVAELELDELDFNDLTIDVAVVPLGIHTDIDVDVLVGIWLKLVVKQVCFGCSGNDVLL